MKGTFGKADTESKIESMSKILRTEAPYLPTGLCSLSLLITGTEPVSSLLPSPQDFHSILTDAEVYAEIEIDPKFFSSRESNLGQLNGLFREFFSFEKRCLEVIEGIERELSIISTLKITEIHRRVIEKFLTEFKRVVETQQAFYSNMASHEASILSNGIEGDKAAADLFLALYDTNEFKEHRKALRSLVDYWTIMDALLIEYKEDCRKIEQRLPIIAEDCRYAFGARVVQICSRRQMLAKELLKFLNSTDLDQTQPLLQCYRAIAYAPTCDNLLTSFRQDGYLHPSALPPLLETYFNPEQSGTLINSLIYPETQDSLNAFLNFVAQNGASVRLQFFRDIYALFKRKPLYVTDLQLLAPYFCDANPLKLEAELLTYVKKELYDDNPNASIKMKQIVSMLIPAIEAVNSDFNEMRTAFLAAPDLIPALSSMSLEPAVTVLPPALHSEAAIEMRNSIATAFFKREIEKQIALLQAADIFHDACFKNLVDLICREILDPLLKTEEDELHFLTLYAKALLEIPYYLMSALPKNFTEKCVNKKTILSYNFCTKLNSSKTGLHLQSLIECLSKNRAIFEAKNRDFLAAVENSSSVFDLFNRIKDHSDPTVYTTLKEDICSLNRVKPGMFDRNQMGLVAPTPALVSRVRADGRPEQSTNITPFCDSVETQNRTQWPPSPSSSSPPRAAEITSHIDFKKLARELDTQFKEEGLQLKKYILSCTHDLKEYLTPKREAICNYLEVRKSEKLLLTAQSSGKDSSVTIYCHQEDLVAKTMAAIADSARAAVTTLEININASKAEVPLLINQYVTQALEKKFLPKVIINGVVLQPEELCGKLDKSLAQTYNKIMDEVKQGNLSKNRMGHFATRSNDKQSTARRLFQDQTDKKPVILSERK